MGGRPVHGRHARLPRRRLGTAGGVPQGELSQQGQQWEAEDRDGEQQPGHRIFQMPLSPLSSDHDRPRVAASLPPLCPQVVYANHAGLVGPGQARWERLG